MRRISLIVAATAIAVVAYGKPRAPELPLVIDGTRSASLLAPLTTTSGDTVWYGGTTWAADSIRWEALRDSVWTFDTGVGSSINTGQNANKPIGYHETMEGWFGIDQTLPETWSGVGHFRRSSTCAISGSWSLWAGVPEHEADSLCYGAGQGYGNSWHMWVGKAFAYPGTGSVTFSYKYAVECEPGLDFAYVVIDTTGSLNPENATNPITLAQYTGSASGTGTFVLQPGFTLPSSPRTFTIWFNVESDGSYSDEDGLYATTCGHSVFDDISLTGAVTDVTDLEAGTSGWTEFTAPTGYGDFSNVSALADIPPPLASCLSLQDSVLTFFDPTLHHSFLVDNISVSPWIDLKQGGDAGRPGRLISYDVYTDLPINEGVFIQLRARWYPYVCPNTGVVRISDFHDQNIVYYFGESPICRRHTRNYSNVIPPEAEQVQIAIGLVRSGACPPGCTFDSNASPYIDNLRFGVYGTPTSDVREVTEPPSAQLLAASPNPLSTTTRISFTTPADGRARLIVFDVAGRHVRTLVDSPLPAGRHDIIWDVRDDAGRRVNAGLYFCRLTSGDYMVARKLVVAP